MKSPKDQRHGFPEIGDAFWVRTDRVGNLPLPVTPIARDILGAETLKLWRCIWHLTNDALGDRTRHLFIECICAK